MKTLVRLSAATALLFSAAAMAQEYTPPDTKLAVGQSAVLPFHIPYEPDIPAKVTVTAIEAGSMADLEQAGFKATPEQQHLKPFYVRYTVTMLGSPKNLSGSSLNAMYAIDDRREARMNSLTNSNFSGARFDKCRDGAFKSGDGTGSSYSSCQFYLIDQSGSIATAAFRYYPDKKGSVPSYFNNPVTWTVGAAPAPQAQDGTGTIDSN